MPLGDPINKPYSILVSRSVERPNAELYEFDLSDPIPSLQVPLHSGDAEPWVKLQELLNEIYTRARLDLAIDYSQPLRPTLTEQEADWISNILP